jgi:hypothetical protein
MSLVLVAVYPDALVVVTDSVTYDTDHGSMAWSTKAWTLPHLDAVLTGVGRLDVKRSAMWAIDQVDSTVQDVDAVALGLPAVLAQTWLDRPNPNPHHFANLALAGWSPTRGAMVAYRFASERRFEIEARTDGVSLWPPPADPSTITLPESEQDWIDLAEHLRSEQIDAEHPILIGGRLVLTVVQRGACAQRTIHTFDDRPELWREYLGRSKPTQADQWTLPTPMRLDAVVR